MWPGTTTSYFTGSMCRESGYIKRTAWRNTVHNLRTCEPCPRARAPLTQLLTTTMRPNALVYLFEHVSVSSLPEKWPLVLPFCYVHLLCVGGVHSHVHAGNILAKACAPGHCSKRRGGHIQYATSPLCTRVCLRVRGPAHSPKGEGGRGCLPLEHVLHGIHVGCDPEVKVTTFERNCSRKHSLHRCNVARVPTANGGVTFIIIEILFKAPSERYCFLEPVFSTQGTCLRVGGLCPAFPQT